MVTLGEIHNDSKRVYSCTICKRVELNFKPVFTGQNKYDYGEREWHLEHWSNQLCQCKETIAVSWPKVISAIPMI